MDFHFIYIFIELNAKFGGWPVQKNITWILTKTSYSLFILFLETYA